MRFNLAQELPKVSQTSKTTRQHGIRLHYLRVKGNDSWGKTPMPTYVAPILLYVFQKAESDPSMSRTISSWRISFSQTACMSDRPFICLSGFGRDF